MKTQKKIGWQKYEDMLEQQLYSPLLSTLYKNIMDQVEDDTYIVDEMGEAQEQEYVGKLESSSQGDDMLLPLDQKLMESISLVSNFDCWMGHTNFNITENIKDKLNKMDGVEVLKICSRYRFFVGVGRMFDFKEVRSNIEKHILNEGKNIE